MSEHHDTFEVGDRVRSTTAWHHPRLGTVTMTNPLMVVWDATGDTAYLTDPKTVTNSKRPPK